MAFPYSFEVPRRPGRAEARRPLPRLHRYRAGPRRLSACRFPHPGRQAPGDRVVQQRLSGHGPAPQGARGHARGHRRDRRRGRRHPQHLRQHPLPRRARSRTGRPARQGCRAALHLGLRLQRRDAGHAGQAAAGTDRLFGCAEPCLDDRGHPPRRHGKAHLPPQRHGRSRGPAGRRAGRRAQADRLRIRLFDGWRFRPLSTRSAIWPRNTAP